MAGENCGRKFVAHPSSMRQTRNTQKSVEANTIYTVASNLCENRAVNQVEFPDSRIYDEAMSILRYENRFICNRCGGEECSSVTEGQARERQRLDVEKMGQ